jgi:tetratricopeptide (TPR) repeat protein
VAPASGPAGATGIYERLVASLESGTNPAASIVRPPKLMDVVVKYPYAIAELESYIGTLRADDVDKQYVFYNWLVDAYVNNGRAADELARREPAVLAGTAGRKDVAIWLGLSARQPEAAAIELARKADESGVAASALSGFQRLLLARLYVAAGRRDKAVDAYIGVANAVLAGAANTLQSPASSLVVDPFGRDNGLMHFTGIGIFDEARQRLDADGLNQFVAAMLAMSKPSGSPSLDQSYARFVFILSARARQAGLTIPALQQGASALQPGVGWTRTEMLQATAAAAEMGRLDDALAMLKRTMQRDTDSREPLGITGVITLASRQYQIALGLTGSDPAFLTSLQTGPLGIEEFRAAFPASASAWPGARDWVDRAVRSVPEWVAEKSVSRDAGLQVQSLLAVRLNQMGDAAAARDAAKHLDAMFRAGPVSIRGASLAVTVADKVGAPIDLAILQDLVRTNRLHVSRVAAVLARTATTEGADKALELGAAAAEFTSADELLRQLIAIARNANNAAEVQRWTDRQREAAAARTTLMRRVTR